MRLFRNITLSVSIFGLILFGSCETDFSLNGDYQIEPVVFGLLDHHDDFHVVKITKAFLGDGDNLVYAQIPDSNYFNTVNAKVVEIKNDSPTGREWVLFDTVLTNKSTDGIFYAPEQKVYAFFESDLDSSATYELTADLDGGRQVTGSTKMIEGFKVNQSILYPSFKIIFAEFTVTTPDDYIDWSFTVTEAENASLYNYKYTVHYTETYADNSTASFSITRDNGEIEQEKPGTPSIQGPTFRGEDFYIWIQDNIPQDDNVVLRRFNSLDLKISIAHHELDQYMQVGEPVTGIAQVQPEYTNLTGGRGLFSSRHIYEITGMQLHGNSIKQLCIGQYTNELLFKSNLPEHSGEPFYQP